MGPWSAPTWFVGLLLPLILLLCASIYTTQRKDVLHIPFYNKGTAFSHRERYDRDAPPTAEFWTPPHAQQGHPFSRGDSSY